MIYYSNDPLLDFDRHQADEEAWLMSRPVCKDCREHIQDEEAYHSDGIWICRSCFESNLTFI